MIAWRVVSLWLLTLALLPIASATGQAAEPAQPDQTTELPAIEIGKVTVEAFRSIRTGADETARTGVIGRVIPHGEALVVIRGPIWLLTGDDEKTGQGESLFRHESVSSDEVVLEVGDARVSPIGMVSPFGNFLEMRQRSQWYISESPQAFSMVFDVPALTQGPWVLTAKNASAKIETPPDKDDLKDEPDRVDQAFDIALVETRVVEHLPIISNPMAKTFVEYRYPTGAIVEIRVATTSRRPPRRMAASDERLLHITTQWWGLRDKTSGHYIPAVGELFMTGLSSRVGNQFSSNDGDGRTFHLYFAAPKTMTDFDVLLLGEPVATGSVKR